MTSLIGTVLAMVLVTVLVTNLGFSSGTFRLTTWLVSLFSIGLVVHTGEIQASFILIWYLVLSAPLEAIRAVFTERR